MRNRHYGETQGMTLVEILVVLVIIAILAALVFTVLGPAKGKAREAQCINNLHQLLMAFSMYAADNDGFLMPRPRSGVPLIPLTDEEERHLVSAYAQYGANADLWHCPAQPRPATPEEGRTWLEMALKYRIAVGNPYWVTYLYFYLPKMEVHRYSIPPRFGQRPLRVTKAIIQDCFLIEDLEQVPLGLARFPHGPSRDADRVCVGFVDGRAKCFSHREWLPSARPER
jgi:prepilin-type N-terminal cleavage/methylation domain-containing protein